MFCHILPVMCFVRNAHGTNETLYVSFHKIAKGIIHYKKMFLKVAPLRRLFNLIRSVSYVPWVSEPFFINTFFAKINDLKFELHESMHADFDAYTDYFKRNYFN